MANFESNGTKEEILENWEEYEKRIQELEKCHNTATNVSPLLFRGQANSEWKLETTLERFTSSTFSVESYNWLTKRIKPNIESYTNRPWEFKDYEEDPTWPFNPCVPNAEFVVYLRHMGFPSPLLDWSLSPYVAAYFAFNNAQEKTNGFVSIYTYWESSVGARLIDKKKPYINTLNRDVKTHKRHYVQQSQYTFCQCFSEKKAKSFYCSHEKALNQEPKMQTINLTQAQDLLWCYKIPTSEKYKVLKKLDLMNITSYTLFNTEEALMNVLARQHITDVENRKSAINEWVKFAIPSQANSD